MSRHTVRGAVSRRMILAAAMVVYFSLAGGSAWGQTTHKIQVEGYARLAIEPDVAYLSLGIETQGNTAEKAQAQLADRAAKVLSALTQAGLDPSKIKTSSYEVSPVYSSKPDKQNMIVGYAAETTLTAEISSLPMVAGMIDAAMAAGANAVRSVSYERADMESFKEQLIRDACLDAAKKASAAAGALGVRLGAPVSVDVQDSFTARESSALVMVKAATNQDFLSPGELEISVSVRVGFELLAN